MESPTSLNITESTQISPWAPHYTDYTLITSSAIKGFSNSTSVLRGSAYGKESTLICVCHAHGGDHGLPALPARLGGSLAQSRVPWVLALPGWHTAVPSLVTFPLPHGGRRVFQPAIPLIPSRLEGSFVQLGTHQGSPSCQDELCPGTHSVEGRVTRGRGMCHSRAHPKSKPAATRKKINS